MSNCELCAFPSMGTLISSALYHKYSENVESMHLHGIDLLVEYQPGDQLTPEIARHKEAIYLDDQDEFMRREYASTEFDAKVRSITEYYKFQKYEPVQPDSTLNRIMGHYYDRRKAYDYKLIKAVLKRDQQLSITTQKSSQIYSDIDSPRSRYSNLLGQLKKEQELDLCYASERNESQLLASVCRNLQQIFKNKPTRLDSICPQLDHSQQVNDFENYLVHQMAKQRREQRKRGKVVKKPQLQKYMSAATVEENGHTFVPTGWHSGNGRGQQSLNKHTFVQSSLNNTKFRPTIPTQREKLNIVQDIYGRSQLPPKSKTERPLTSNVRVQSTKNLRTVSVTTTTSTSKLRTRASSLRKLVNPHPISAYGSGPSGSNIPIEETIHQSNLNHKVFGSERPYNVNGHSSIHLASKHATIHRITNLLDKPNNKLGIVGAHVKGSRGNTITGQTPKKHSIATPSSVGPVKSQSVTKLRKPQVETQKSLKKEDIYVSRNAVEAMLKKKLDTGQARPQKIYV